MNFKNIIKLIIVSALLILGLGYCGQMDSEYESQREMMATYWEK